MTEIEDIQKNVQENKDFVEYTLNKGERWEMLIYVNGNVYDGLFTISCKRGFGWKGSLPHSLELPKVDPSSDVYAAFLSYGKLRHFKYEEETDRFGNNDHPMCWVMVTEDGDTDE